MREIVKWIIGLLGAVLLCILIAVSGEKTVDLEDRNYILTMGIEKKGDLFEICLSAADINKLAGDTKQEIETKQYGYEARDYEDLLKQYNKEQKKTLDVGHIKAILIEEKSAQNAETLSEITKILAFDTSIAKTTAVYEVKDLNQVMKLEKKMKMSLGLYLSDLEKNNLERCGYKKTATLGELLYGKYEEEGSFLITVGASKENEGLPVMDGSHIARNFIE